MPPGAPGASGARLRLGGLVEPGQGLRGAPARRRTRTRPAVWEGASTIVPSSPQLAPRGLPPISARVSPRPPSQRHPLQLAVGEEGDRAAVGRERGCHAPSVPGDGRRPRGRRARAGRAATSPSCLARRASRLRRRARGRTARRSRRRGSRPAGSSRLRRATRRRVRGALASQASDTTGRGRAAASASPASAERQRTSAARRGAAGAGGSSVAASVSSRRASPMSWSRSRGSLRRQRRSRRRTPGGVSAGSADQSTSSRSTAARTSAGDAPRNARRPGQHLVEQAAESPDVGARVDGHAAGLLGAHVGRRPQDVPGSSSGRRRPSASRSSERATGLAMPKSRTFTRPASPELDVGGLEVAVHDPLAVRLLERLRDLERHRRPPLGRAAGPRRSRSASVCALDQLQDEVGRAVDHLEAVDRRDVRVVQRGEQPRLALEAAQARPRRSRRSSARALIATSRPSDGIEGAVDAAHPADRRAGRAPRSGPGARRARGAGARLARSRAPAPPRRAPQPSAGRQPLASAPRRAQQLARARAQRGVLRRRPRPGTRALGGRPLERGVQQRVEPREVFPLKHRPCSLPCAPARRAARRGPASSPAAPCAGRAPAPPRSPPRSSRRSSGTRRCGPAAGRARAGGRARGRGRAAAPARLSLRRQPRFVELDGAACAGAALDAQARARAAHQHLAHRAGGHRHEVARGRLSSSPALRASFR